MNALQQTFSAIYGVGATILGTFSWAKVIYSAILVGLIAIAIAELGRLWLDTRTYVGTFTFFENGKEQSAEGTAFSLQVLIQHRMLSQLFAAEERRRKSAVDPKSPQPVASVALQKQENTWWPHEVPPVHNPKSLLSDIELSVQGINVRDILTKFRQWITAPKEIGGTVNKTDAGVRASVSWTEGPAADGLVVLEPQPDAWKAALHVACSMIWTDEKTRQQDIARVTRADFCGWTDAWVSFVALRDKQNTLAGISDADVEQLKKVRDYATKLISSSTVYPEVYRLRADIVDLIPAAKKVNEDFAQAQEDRTRYSLLLNPSKSRLQILAEARPAIEISDGAISGPVSETWTGALTPFTEHIRAAVRATGFGRLQKKGAAYPGFFAGFAIAKGIIITVRFGLNLPKDVRMPFVPDDSYDAEFSFAEQTPTPGEAIPRALRILQVLYTADMANGDHLAVLRIEGHDIVRNPPLVIERSTDSLNTLVGRYAFVVGFPMRDTRLPTEFVDALLGQKEGVKRVMPGRILALEKLNGQKIRRVTSDISTTGGSAGGPLVDLQTGRVLGLHHSGQWRYDDQSGKFTWADLIADIPIPANILSEP
jgi:hypothetical protein